MTEAKEQKKLKLTVEFNLDPDALKNWMIHNKVTDIHKQLEQIAVEQFDIVDGMELVQSELSPNITLGEAPIIFTETSVSAPEKKVYSTK
jgi:hypothetical protein